jgi:tetratricopeptide (TPR) repeat protein
MANARRLKCIEQMTYKTVLSCAIGLAWIAVAYGSWSGIEGDLVAVGVERDNQSVTEVVAAAKKHDSAQVISLCTTGLTTAKDSRERAFYFAFRGHAYLNRRELEKAIRDFNETVRLNPKVASVYGGRAYIYQITGKTDAALKEYGTAIGVDRNYLPAYDNRGSLYQAKGDAKRAIADYDVAIRIDPTDPAAYATRGVACYYKGEKGKATRDLAEAAKLLEPSDSQEGGAMNTVAYFRATCPEGDFRNGKQALQLARRACESFQWRSWGAISTLAAAYAECGDFENAIKYEKQAFAMSNVPPRDRSKMKFCLALYEQHKPYHLRRTSLPQVIIGR